MPSSIDLNTLTGSISAQTTSRHPKTPIGNVEIESVGLAVKPASPIRLLCEELPKVYVFFAHKILTTYCAPFPERISHFKVLALP